MERTTRVRYAYKAPESQPYAFKNPSQGLFRVGWVLGTGMILVLRGAGGSWGHGGCSRRGGRSGSRHERQGGLEGGAANVLEGRETFLAMMIFEFAV